MVDIRSKNFDVSGLIERVRDPQSGLNLTLASSGLRTTVDDYIGDGYGVIRIHDERIEDVPVVVIGYDLGTKIATKVEEYVPQSVVKGLLIPVVDEPSGFVSHVFDYLGFPRTISSDEEFSFRRYISQKEIEQRKTSLVVPESNNIELPHLQELIDLEKETGVKMFDLTDDVIVQGEYSIGQWSAIDPKERPPEYRSPRTMRTFGVGPCVVLALYNDDDMSGALFHIDNPGQLNRRIIEPISYAIRLLTSQTDEDRIRGRAPTKPKAKLVGGINNSDSKKTVVGIHECLRANGVEVVGRRILQNEVYNVVLDLFTGKLFSYDTQIDSTGEDLKIRLLRAHYNSIQEEPLVNIAPNRRL